MCCEVCWKYKPERAIDVFSWKTETLGKYKDEVASIEE